MRISDWSSDVCSSDLDGSAQHLISAADAGDMPAPPHMGGDVDVPTLRAQELQIGNGRFSAGQDYERSAGRDRLSWGNHGEPHGWLLRQRVRSDEHTSELQSLMRMPDAVFCLKKKN